MADSKQSKNILGKIANKIWPKDGKHDGVNMAGGSPAATASLEELLTSLSKGVAMALASYYTGNFNVGADMNKLASGGVKNNKGRSILGSDDSLYNFVEQIHKILDKTLNEDNINKIITSLNKNTNTGSIPHQNDIDEDIKGHIEILVKGLSGANIQDLIKFSEINLDNLENNTIKITNFLQALKSLSLLNFDTSINIVESLNSIIDPLFNFAKNIPSDDILKNANESILYINSIIDLINALNVKSKNLKDIQNNISTYVNIIKNFYTEVNKIFDDIEITANKATLIANSNRQILLALNDIEETAKKAGENEKYIKKSIVSLQGMTEFMIGAAAVMSIGALFVMMGGGKFIKSALLFGVALGMFEALVIAPVMLFSQNKAEVFKGINDLNSFIVTCTTVMLIGALFVNIGGGKYLLSSFLFGIALGVFEALVIAPFLLFDKDKSLVLESVKNFSSFLIVCTTVMLIGALFMQLGGGKFVVNALAFGFVLMAFEALVIAPFLLFNKIDHEIFSGIKSFTTAIVVCTTVLLIGALFMQLGGGKFVKAALEFTGVLMLFEAAVIAPFLLFNLIKHNVLSSLKDFALVLFVSTTCLLIGSLFMKSSWMPLYALEFTGILSLFIGAISTIIVGLSIWLDNRAMLKMEEFGLFVAISSLSLITGALFVKKYGYDSAITYGTILTVFVGAMSLIAAGLTWIMNPVTMTSLTEFTIFVGTLHFVIITGSIFAKTFGNRYIDEYSNIIGDFVGRMSLVAVLLSHTISKKSMDSLKNFAIFVGTLHLVIVTGSLFVNKYGIKPIEDYGTAISGFTTMMGIIVVGIAALMKDKKTLNSLKNFSIFVGALHLILLTGSLFVSKYGTKDIYSYGIAISTFTTIMGLVVAGINFLMRDEKTLNNLKNFLIFVGVLHVILLTGAWFITKYKIQSVEDYALAMIKFTGGMAIVFGILSMAKDSIQKGGKAALLIALGIGALGISVGIVLYLFKNYTPEEILLKVGSLALITTAFGVIFGIIGNFGTLVAIGGAIALEMSLAIFALGMSVGIVLDIFKDYTPEEILLKVGSLALITTGFGVIFGILGAPGINALVAIGGAIALEMSLAIFTLGVAIGNTVNIFKSFSEEEVLHSIKLLSESVGLYSLLFAALGIPPFNLLTVLGSTVLVPMSYALNLIGENVGNTVNIFSKYKPETVESSIKFLSSAIASYGKVFMALGLPPFSLLAALGSKTLIPMSNALKMISASFVIVVKNANEYRNNIQNDIKTMKDLISTDISELFKSIASSPYIKASLGITAMQYVVFGIYGVVKSIIKTIELIRNIGDISELISTVSENISSYVSIPQKITIDKNIKNNIKFIKQVSDDIAKILGDVGEGVYKIASLQIPYMYDNNGKPIKYRQLKDEDFTLASGNTALLLTTMTQALYDIWTGNAKLPDGTQAVALSNMYNDRNSAINKVIDVSNKIGELIGNIGEGISKIAKLEIPVEYNDKGKAIRFRQLKTKDFDMAGKGISKILTLIISSLGKIYKDGTKWGDGTSNIFDDGAEGFLGIGKKPSSIAKVLGVSFQIGELIGNIGEGITKIATLQIPYNWDNKTGKVIEYRTLTPQDFKNMGKGISTILTSIFGELTNIYNENPTLFDTTTAGLLGEITGKQNLSPMEKVLSASMQISTLIANIGEGISKIAVLQIPDQWDEKTGKPIHYKELTTQNFKDAGQSIADILTTVINALDENKDKIDTNKVEEILKLTKPISEFISNTAEGIIALASGQIATNWDPKTGKPIYFKELTSDDYIKAATTVAGIVIGIGKSLVDLAEGNAVDQNGNKIDFKDYILDSQGKASGKLAIVIESFTGISSIVSDMADAVIKLGQGLIADRWNPETGKPTHYKPIDYKNILPNIKTVIGEIIKSTSTAIIETVNTNSQLFKEDGEFGQAVTAIQGVTKIASDIVNMIINIGSAQIPTKWKDGKPIWYEKIDIKTAKDNIKNIMSDVLGSFIDSIKDQVINPKGSTTSYNQIKDKIEEYNSVISIIVNTVSSVSKLITGIASNKIPEGFNADGSVTSYTTLNHDLIKDAQQNIKDMIIGLLSIFDETVEDNIMVKSLDTNKVEKILKKSEDIQLLLESIQETISPVLSTIESITNQKDKLLEIYKYKSQLKTSSVNTVILDIFKDITQIISDFKELSTTITNTISSLNNIDYTKTTDSLNNLSDFIDDIIVCIIDIDFNELINNDNIKILMQKKQYVDTINGQKNQKEDFLFAYTIKQSLESIYQVSKNISLYGEKIPTIDRNFILPILLNVTNTTKDILNIFNNFYNLSESINYINGQTYQEKINNFEQKITLIIKSFNTISKILTDNKVTKYELNKDTFKSINNINFDIYMIISNFLQISNIISKNINQQNFNIDNLNNIIKFYENISSLLLTFKGSNENDIKQVIENITTINSSIETLFEGFNNSYIKYLSNALDFNNSLIFITNTFKDTKSDLNDIVDNIIVQINKMIEIYKIDISQYKDNNIFSYLTSNLSNYILNGIDKFNELEQKKSDLLNDSINKIYQNIISQKSANNAFRQNTDQIKKYVQAINSIDIRKTSTLLALVRELNELSKRMGNLDNLTTAISERLSFVLEQLSIKLQESKETIETADEIQRNRHRLIKDAIDQVQYLMDKPLNITVESKQPTSPDNPTDTTNPNSGRPTTQTGGGSGEEVQGYKKTTTKTTTRDATHAGASDRGQHGKSKP